MNASNNMFRSPAGFSLPPLPATSHKAPPPLTRVRRTSSRDRIARWDGRIIARAWPLGFDACEYRLLLVGGRRRRLAAPDAYTQGGAPLYYLSDRERRQRERGLNAHARDVYETHNIATTAGRTTLLNYVANTGGLTGVQYFGVGTGAIPAGQSGPLSSDTALWTEFYRQAISTATISNGQVDLSTIFSAGVGNATYTNAGIFGDGATGTSGSGVLFAHALYSYQKNASTVLTNDYYISLA